MRPHIANHLEVIFRTQSGIQQRPLTRCIEDHRTDLSRTRTLHLIQNDAPVHARTRQTCHRTQQRRLSMPVRSDETVDRTRGKLSVHRIYEHLLSIRDRQRLKVNHRDHPLSIFGTLRRTINGDTAPKTTSRAPDLQKASRSSLAQGTQSSPPGKRNQTRRMEPAARRPCPRFQHERSTNPTPREPRKPFR